MNISILSKSETQYILPIIIKLGDRVELKEKEVVFNNMLSIASNCEYMVDPADERRHFHPVGGFQYKNITFDIKTDKALNIKIKII